MRAFEEVKDAFDPKGLMNPGKIVRAPKFDDRTLFAIAPGYRADAVAPVLDWSAYPGRRAAASRAPSRCATTTAPAASSRAARCARPIASRAMSST